ncbi:hypothetical protein KFL_001200190 [Klebsormidium nitens]|uniref:Uncharacterized protein n=1 Tax=Klebsormidium nitens TaxID=105231 RepID=A0A1Y1HVP9_KLENI|nr:hypothetical protein KFL_001200190 [Klebsormidium nitens]|eukprot:GAQ82695.1 hypothetical protein KFL_001200190 [Klebsormidium nitens]
MLRIVSTRSYLGQVQVLKLQPYVTGSEYPEVLDCHAHIDDLAVLSQLVNLEELEIIRVVIYSVPDWLGNLSRLKAVYLSKFVPHHAHPYFNLHRLAHIQQLKLRFVNEIPTELAALSNLELLMMDAWRSELDFGSLSTCPKLKVITIDSSRNLQSGYMTIKGLEKVPNLEAFQYLPEHLNGDIVLGEGGLINLKNFVATAGAGRLLLEGSPQAFERLCHGAKKIVISMHDKSATDEKIKVGIQGILRAARASV